MACLRDDDPPCRGGGHMPHTTRAARSRKGSQNGASAMGTVVRIAPRSSSTTRPGAQIIHPVQFRNLSGKSGHVPPLDQLLREGRASNRRIQEHEKGTRSLRKLILTEWLDQAERLDRKSV